MKLSELVTLQVKEAEEPSSSGPVEVKDLVEFYPKNVRAAIMKLWGGPRLVYHGHKFFSSENEAGDLYDMINVALKSYVNDGHEIEMSIPVQPAGDLDMGDMNYDATIDDYQEVYLGYDPKSDNLFVGIDAWLNEQDFNDAWDREFEKYTGVQYDEENEQHQAMFKDAWESYKGLGFQGLLFEMTLNGETFDLEPALEMSHGFYKGIYRTPQFKDFGLIDLRLD